MGKRVEAQEFIIPPDQFHPHMIPMLDMLLMMLIRKNQYNMYGKKIRSGDFFSMKYFFMFPHRECSVRKLVDLKM